MKIPIFLSFLFIIANAGKRFDKSLIISMPVYIKADTMVIIVIKLS